MNPEIVFRYFPGLTDDQKQKFIMLKPLYDHWNSMINVISRKDMDMFYTHHVLHSLSISRIVSFAPGTKVLDVGTGGGFPGIPLAIFFPMCEFFLLDSIAKKIRVVQAVTAGTGLANVTAVNKRIEEEKGRYDFIISRAVTRFDAFVKLTKGKVLTQGRNQVSNGIIYLKGGDLAEELKGYSEKIKIREIKEFFGEPFFETKKIVYLPVT